jgi:hypothetical protein
MGKMFNKMNMISGLDWQNLLSDSAYSAWKNDKIKTFKGVNAAAPIMIESLESASFDSICEIKDRIAVTNFAVYQSQHQSQSVDECAVSLKSFAANFGLVSKETHRSEGQDGVVALATSSEKSKQGYIPYTPKALSWHTDGYYNADDSKVLAFALHCYEPAHQGGENQLIDPEIAYIRLRDANPAFINAFFHPEAMTIPANTNEVGTVRPASVGPVFFVDQATGRLQMRYTARTRSIEWRDDPTTRAASHWMREWLASDEEFKIELKLDKGQGILNNNVLHNRTSFVDDPSGQTQRTMMRVRFHNRIAEV